MATTSPATSYILPAPTNTPASPPSVPLPSSPSSSTLEVASPPSSYAYLPTMMSVVYPQYVAAGQPQQQQVYYAVAAPSAGQWTTVGVQQANTGTYYYVQQPQMQAPQMQTQAMAHQGMPPTVYAMPPQHRPRTTSMVTPRPMSTMQPAVYSMQPQVQQITPPTMAKPMAIPYASPQGSITGLRRRPSVAFDDAISVDSEPFAPASPVLSDTTSSSSSSGSSASSHLNLSRSAMNHYMAPQKDRPTRPQSILRSSSYDVPQPRQSMLIAQPTGPAPLYAQPTGMPVPAPIPAPSAPVAVPRTVGPSSRPISFHEDQVPVYSSYELYQSGGSRGSHPPVTRPVLTRRASSRSLAGSYGAGLGMGGGAPGIMGFSSMDDMDAKRKWWKVGR